MSVSIDSIMDISSDNEAFSCCLSRAVLSSWRVMKPSPLVSICLNKRPNSWIYFSGIWEAMKVTDKVLSWVKNNYTLENLENSLSFLNWMGRGIVLTLPAFIQGCYKIYLRVSRFYLGTRIFFMRSLRFELSPMAYSAK